MKLVDSLRPKDFDSLIGLSAVKDFFNPKTDENLNDHLKEMHHSYIFSGESGCGKTSTARIIANKLNAEIVEINAGADTGIDLIRDIINTIDLSTLTGFPRVFILDEAHKLSLAAQNGLLKPLEDGFIKDYIIFCTNDQSKLLKTLRQRCLLFNFPKFSETECIDLITKTIDSIEFNLLEKKISDPSIELTKQLIYLSEGSPRLLINLLEQTVRSGHVPENILDQNPEVFELFISLWKKDVTMTKIFEMLENINQDPESIRIALVNMFGGSFTKAIKESNNYKIDFTKRKLDILLDEQRLLEPDKKIRLNLLIYRLKMGD